MARMDSRHLHVIFVLPARESVTSLVPALENSPREPQVAQCQANIYLACPRAETKPLDAATLARQCSEPLAEVSRGA